MWKDSMNQEQLKTLIEALRSESLRQREAVYENEEQLSILRYRLYEREQMQCRLHNEYMRLQTELETASESLKQLQGEIE